MISNNVKIFPNPFETVRAFAHYLLDLINRKAKVNIALSGGSTPKILFDYLATYYAQSGIWNGVNFYWGDERCVPPQHPDSNYRMTKEHLLNKINISEDNIHRICGENDPQEEAKKYSDILLQEIPLILGVPVMDLIILGMGEDGHTASIFPNQMALLTSQNLCDVAEHPSSGQKRITLSGRPINSAKEIVFLVTGHNKKEKVFEILKQTGNWKKYPAAYIKPKRGKLSWFLDREAASLL